MYACPPVTSPQHRGHADGSRGVAFWSRNGDWRPKHNNINNSDNNSNNNKVTATTSSKTSIMIISIDITISSINLFFLEPKWRLAGGAAITNIYYHCYYYYHYHY